MINLNFGVIISFDGKKMSAYYAEEGIYMANKKEVILLKEGEIALKGLNRRSFESAFIKNLKYRLKPLGKFEYTCSQSMIFIEPLEDDIDMDRVFARVSKVFGASAVCRALQTDKSDLNALCEDIIEYVGPELENARTFRSASRSRYRG